jgi:hypothetical protein
VSPLVCAALLGAAGCTGAITGGGEPGGPEDCPATNSAPDAPTVTSPEAGRVDIVGDELTVVASPFVDPDGDPHLETQWEIWQVAGGSPVQRVWTASSDDPLRLTQVALADGVFEVGAGLAQDKTYEVQVRYRSGDGCPSWSAWSQPRRFGTDDGSSYFFAEERIADVYLDVPQSSLDAINAQARPPGCVPYERQSYPAAMTYEGQLFDGVGLKTKGGCGSSRDLSGKPSWKINLEWDDPAVAGCPVTRRLHGVKRITLNNEVQDGSFVHEHLAYHLYRLMGVAVPRTSNARVHVNGEYWGLYLNLETVDRRMLGRWFESNDGMMYEGTYSCDVIRSSVPATDDHDNDVSQCMGREFKPDACSTPDPGADPQDFSRIRQLVAQLEALPPGGYYPEIEEIFDFDALLSMWAVDAVINHWDGFVYQIMNNYRIYHDPSVGKWSVIPSGVDQTFQLNAPRTVAPFSPSNIVARRCLEEADCRAAFAARLEQVLTVFESADLPSRARAIRDRIAADVQADPRKEVSYNGFLDRVEQTIQFIENRPAVIRADLAANGF